MHRHLFAVLAAATVLGGCHEIFRYAHTEGSADAADAADAGTKDGDPLREQGAVDAALDRRIADSAEDAGADGNADGSADTISDLAPDSGGGACAPMFAVAGRSLRGLAVSSANAPQLITTLTTNGAWVHHYFTPPTPAWQTATEQPGAGSPAAAAAAVDGRDMLHLLFSDGSAVSTRRRSISGAPGPWQPAAPVDIAGGAISEVLLQAEGDLVIAAAPNATPAVLTLDASAGYAVSACPTVATSGLDLYLRGAMSALHVAAVGHDGVEYATVRVWDRATFCSGGAPVLSFPIGKFSPRPFDIVLTADAVHVVYPSNNVEYLWRAFAGGVAGEVAVQSTQADDLDVALDHLGRTHIFYASGGSAYWTYRMGPQSWATPSIIGSADGRVLLRRRAGLLHFAWQDGTKVSYRCIPLSAGP